MKRFLLSEPSGPTSIISNTTGFYNTAIGASALEKNTGTSPLHGSDASQNTAIGYSALQKTSPGTKTRPSVAIGYGALAAPGNNNIGIGANAALNVSSASNNIHIGSHGSAPDDGTIRIGTPGTQIYLFAAGVRGITTTNNDAIPVVIDSAGQLGTVSSSRRFKENIQDMGDASRGVMRLRPVTFRYQKSFADGSQPVQYALIAEEVAEVYPDLVAHSADGQIETVKYQVLDSMLLNKVQRQQRIIDAQQHEIEALKAQLKGISVLESRLVALENAVANR